MKYNPTQKRVLSSLLLSAGFILVPSLAFASYQPGQTLDPSCPPSDNTCIVVPSTASSTSISGSFQATSTTATSTFSGGFTAGNNAAFIVDQTATANALTITGSGNIGIGTTKPNYKLQVLGNVAIGTSTVSRTALDVVADTTNTNNDNVMQLQQLQSSFYDAIRFVDANGIERAAAGYGNQQGDCTNGFSCSYYIEISNLNGDQYKTNFHVVNTASVGHSFDQWSAYADGTTLFRTCPGWPTNVNCTSVPSFYIASSTGNVGINTNGAGTTTGNPPPQYLLDVNVADAHTNKIRIADTSSASGAAGGFGAFESVGNRGDANSTFFGRFGASFFRSDGVAISNGEPVGALTFGGQWGTNTSFTQSQLLYPASIKGVAEGSFSSAIAMPVGLAFYTGSVGQDLTTSNSAYGTERLRITNTGFVGIGTSTPADMLDVAGNGVFGTALPSRSNDASFPLNVDDAGANMLRLVRNQIQKVDFKINTAPNRLDLVDTDHSGGVPLSILLDGSGKVGVGTTSPTDIFSAQGNVFISGNIDSVANIAATGTLAVAGLTTLGNASTTQITATNSTYFATAGGSVSIGTTTAVNNTALNVAGGRLFVDPNKTNSSNTDTNALSVVTTGATDAIRYTQANIGAVFMSYSNTQGVFGVDGGDIAFKTAITGANPSNGTDRLHISSTGNIGIGNTTPYSRLQVSGPDSASSTSAFTVVSSASTTVFAVFDGGNAQLSGTLTQSSDVRLKTNIQSLDASTSLAAINSLAPVAYDWIDPNKDGTRQYRFIAQQVQQVFPNLVSTTSATALTPDGTLGLNYLGLIAPLVEAVQTLSADLSSLATRVSSLETAVAGFANRFTTKQLCVEKSDGTPVCLTGDQLSGILSGTPSVQISTPTPPVISGTTTPPSINIQGNNPATINVGDTYTDLGAIVHDNQGHDLSYRTFINGVLSGNILIDTAQAATDTIDYVATDTWGNTATSTPTVIIEAATSSVQ
jgi:Chaperone of endosialidase